VRSDVSRGVAGGDAHGSWRRRVAGRWIKCKVC
jgi:hypothetical protein